MATGMIRWAPADLLRHRFDRLFDNPFGDYLDTARSGEEVSNRTWVPAVDIFETADGLSLNVELPGMKAEDIEITVENRVLTLRGERKFDNDVARESYHRIERSYGAFSRSFSLPSNLRSDDVKATFHDGVLTIALPKAEESKPRKIAIQ